MASLIIDYTIDKIIKNIQAKYKDKNGNQLEYNTIVKVIESQINSTIEGMANGDKVVWKYFGTFMVTERRMRVLNEKFKKLGKIPTIQDTGLSEPISFIKK